jgi:hypothetical protein
MPASPGVYLYKDAAGKVIYVGKAKSLRDRVRSYFLEEKLGRRQDQLAAVGRRPRHRVHRRRQRERGAGARKQSHQAASRASTCCCATTRPIPTSSSPTSVSASLRHAPARKDGAGYFGPYFPGNLAHRLVHFIHRWFKHSLLPRGSDALPPAAVPGVSHQRCLGPCVEGLTTEAEYGQAVDDVARISSTAAAGADARPERAHAGGLREDGVRARRRGCGTCWPPSRRWRSASAWPPPRARRGHLGVYAEPPWWRQPLPCPQRPRGRPAGVLLGGAARASTRGVLGEPADADLP